MLITGGVAQMVERSLSMREVPGSIPGISKLFRKCQQFLLILRNILIRFRTKRLEFSEKMSDFEPIFRWK